MALDLTTAVDNADSVAVEAAIRKLTSFGNEASQFLNPKDQQQLVWKAAVVAGSLPILTMVSNYFNIPWMTRNFGSSKAPRTVGRFSTCRSEIMQHCISAPDLALDMGI